MAESAVGGVQVGRRSMVVCAGLVVWPGSDIFTPQELAHRLVALDYGNGTAYAGLQMLEGATPREAITGIQLKEPGHIPEAEARWAWEWMVSWGVLEGSFDPRTQINKAIEHEAHARAATA